jgi:hypothetical protein
MKLIGVSAKHFSKIGYVMFNLFWILLAIATMYAGTWFVSWGSWVGISCPDTAGSGDACFGASGLARISFTLAVFQLVIFLVVLMQNHCAAVIHDGWWTLKFLFVAVFFVCSMWFSNDPFIIGYMKFARIFSVFFLCYQAVLMLVVSMVINNFFVSKVQDGNACSGGGIVLLSLTGIFTAGNIVWIVFQFILFTGNGCGGNVTIMIITCVAIVLIYGVVLLRLRPDASIFTSSLVSSYLLYLQWSALSSDPSPECNPYSFGATSGYNAKANTITMMCLGLLFTFSALLVVGGHTKKAGEQEQLSETLAVVEDENEGAQPLVADEEVKDLEGNKKSAADMHVFPITRSTIYFQFLLMCAAIYYAMVLTNWGNPIFLTSSVQFFASNKTSYWCQLVAMWVSATLYLLSMMLPLCFPNRSFG